MSKYGFNTMALHAGNTDFHPDSMSVPIYQSVAYPFLDAKEAAAISKGEKPGYTYGRWDNPTVEAFEKRMAALECTEAAIAAASGMSAIFLMTHHLVGAGDDVVSSNRVYGGTFGLFNVGLPKMGANIHWVINPESIDEWAKLPLPHVQNSYSWKHPVTRLCLLLIFLRWLPWQNRKIFHWSSIIPLIHLPFSSLSCLARISWCILLPNTSAAMPQPLVASSAVPHELINGIRQNDMRYLGPAMAPFNAWLNLNRS